jgi:hypothetical protein
MILAGDNSQLVYQSGLAASSTVRRSCQQKNSIAAPITGWFPVSRNISGSHQYFLVSCHPRRLRSEWEVGEGNESLVYLSPWEFKRTFTCRKILRHGISGFTSHPKEDMVRIFKAFKHLLPWPDSNPRPLGPVASTLTTTPPRRKQWDDTDKNTPNNSGKNLS